ncbi:methyltransferase domain-containing protein [Streptomyces sp. HSG2]|uniref:methyltransferase domain-containing protein n=1 Tax=Streptomyces sp. HSG2 TaxID=2797167 RepID=UPI001F5B0E5B|nr:methyltransferase domain-containing protein [Streptomyces sp. HSG2]
MVLPPSPSPVASSVPLRQDCPWCGSRRLRVGRRRRGPGVRDGAGRRAPSRCRDCGHGFDDPPSAPGGGPPAGSLARATDHARHLLAARAVLRHQPEPESWLDVGTGEAHFPAVARRLFPYTSFDGLDPTTRVLRARAAERVEEGHVGTPADPHIVALLAARYDVVSLVRQLPAAPDPRAALSAALRLLRPGGHLLVDVTDRFALLPRGGTRFSACLRRELRASGCAVLTPTGSPRVVARRGRHTP